MPLAIAVALGASHLAAAEEVLLLLPKNFDVRPIRGWSRNASGLHTLSAKDFGLGDESLYRFRGEEVTNNFTSTEHINDPRCNVDIRYVHETTGTFRRGVLEGRWVTREHNYYRGCADYPDGEYIRVNHEGVMKGQANADGLLQVRIDVTHEDIYDRHTGWERRNQHFDGWSFGLEFQLPVGELQSSQRLSTPAPATGAQAAPGGGDEDEPKTPAADEPATPAETAAATVGSGLLLAMGAWLFARANGTGPGELLGGLGGLLGTDGPVAPLPPTVTPAGPSPVSDAAPPPEAVTLFTPPTPPPVDPAEARAREMEAQGYRWSDRDGWVTDEQAREYQGQRDRDWKEHLKQDAEAARLEGEIRKAREAQAAARAAQAEHDRHLQLIDRQQELERQQAADRAELSRQDWVGRAVDAVQLAADTAIGEIAQVTGPVGQAIRAGYNATKGMATVVGEAIAEGRGLRPTDIRRGLWLGVENVATDMGLDAAGRKLTGRPGLFEEAAGAAGRAEKAALEAVADPKLASKADELRAALDTTDGDAVLRLYQDHGMKKLAELERLGQISAQEAARLNDTLSKAVDGAVDRGTREALDLWEKDRPGVRLKEVLVGDSGSSAVKGKARSVLTDFDRTTVPIFDPSDVRQYATNRGMTPAQAHQDLTNQFKSIHEKAVGDALPGGLSVEDVDYKSYGGFGSKAGQADAYPSGFATTRQATQGRTTVYPSGGGPPRAASREAIVDQWDMEIGVHGATAPAEIGPRIAPQEFPGIAQEQVKAIAEKGDPKSVAKALDRIAYLTERSELRVTGHSMDEGLARLAAEVKRSPQDVGDVLERAGVSQEEFAERALAEARRLQDAVAGWDHPPSGG